MPKVKLTTKTAVEVLAHPAEGQIVYWDTDLRGFGVLVGVRNKSFVMQRVVKGRSRRINLGRYGEISLHAARKEAERLAGVMRSGTDPVEETRKATADNMTLREAWTLYEAHLVAKERSQRTRDDYWKSLQRYCSDWFDRPLVEITTHARRMPGMSISVRRTASMPPMQRSLHFERSGGAPSASILSCRNRRLSM